MNPLHYIRMKWRHRYGKHIGGGVYEIPEDAIRIEKVVPYGFQVKVGSYAVPGYYQNPLDALEYCNGIRNGLGMKDYNVWRLL